MCGKQRPPCSSSSPAPPACPGACSISHSRAIGTYSDGGSSSCALVNPGVTGSARSERCTHLPAAPPEHLSTRNSTPFSFRTFPIHPIVLRHAPMPLALHAPNLQSTTIVGLLFLPIFFQLRGFSAPIACARVCHCFALIAACQVSRPFPPWSPQPNGPSFQSKCVDASPTMPLQKFNACFPGSNPGVVIHALSAHAVLAAVPCGVHTHGVCPLHACTATPPTHGAHIQHSTHSPGPYSQNSASSNQQHSRL